MMSLLHWALITNVDLLNKAYTICIIRIASAEAEILRRFVCLCAVSRKKLCMNLHEFFIKGKTWPSLKVISFWRWSELTFNVI